MNPYHWQPYLGPNFLDDGSCRFVVWAPYAQTVELHIEAPQREIFRMERDENGYFSTVVAGISQDSLYLYLLDGAKKRPDPASRFQPQGVHGPSQAKAPRGFEWADSAWTGLPRTDLIFYEIHVGTFTPEGTFDAVLQRLSELKSLGVTILELMPVAQFPGSRNWGYDGVYPFAVQNSYGGPDGLRRLVNACHREGLGIALDVVYNHLGPEGNYLADFGPYFTDRYHSPWGQAINFDGPHSDEVRRFFIENALYWLSEFHMDALRLDAIHAIIDTSAQPFLAELAMRVYELSNHLNRGVHVTAECDRNDSRFVRPREECGYGLDAQWNDDFHHALHTVLTKEQGGYYQDFGSIQHLAKAYSTGFVYTGQYSTYRRCRHGNDSKDIPADRFVVFAQNHDQTGNRMFGERLATLVSFDDLKLAAGAVALSPFLPLFFMGEEYGETAPFQYFVSHSDAELVKRIRGGRRREFAELCGQDELPDPQSETVYASCKLQWELREEKQHRILLEFYQELLRLRRSIPALASLSKQEMRVAAFEQEQAVFIDRWRDHNFVFTIFNFGEHSATIECAVPAGTWEKIIDSAEPRWGGRGSECPDVLVASGLVKLEVPSKSFSLYQLRQGD